MLAYTIDRDTGCLGMNGGGTPSLCPGFPFHVPCVCIVPPPMCAMGGGSYLRKKERKKEEKKERTKEGIACGSTYQQTQHTAHSTQHTT